MNNRTAERCGINAQLCGLRLFTRLNFCPHLFATTNVELLERMVVVSAIEVGGAKTLAGYCFVRRIHPRRKRRGILRTKQ